MRKKAWLIIIIAIVLMPVLLYTALRSSYVQNFLVQKVASQLSKEFETDVQVGGIDVTFFLNIVLEDVSVKDRSDQSLIVVERLVFKTGRIGLRKRFLVINKLKFENAEINIVKYKDAEDFNIQFLVDYFSKDTVKKDPKPWDVELKSFIFENSDFSLLDKNIPVSNGQFDPSNISLSGFNMDISNIAFGKDTMAASLNQLSFKESSGLEFEKLSGDLFLSTEGSSVKNMVIKTSHSLLNMNASMEYSSLEDFKNFAENVYLDFDLEKSSLGFIDIGYFSDEFAGKRDKVIMQGNLSGKLSNFRGRDFILAFGRATILDGNFFVSGLPDYDNTFINLSVNEFTTSRLDIDRFAEVSDIKTFDSELYGYLVNLGNVRFTGNLTGFLNDFVAYGDLNTDIGVIKSDIAIYDDHEAGDIGYRGSLAAKSFDVGKFLNQQNTIGEVSLDFFVEGSGGDLESASMELKGKIDTMMLMGYNYNNIDLTGSFISKRFNGNFVIDDPNIVLDFAGVVDFYQSPYRFDFYAMVDNANLTNLNLYQRDSLYQSVISTYLTINTKATNLHDLEGDIIIDNTKYREIAIYEKDVKNYSFDKILISNHIDDERNKNIKLLSEIIDININGNINFDNITNSVNYFFASYMPAWYKDIPDTLLYETDDTDFTYSIDIKDASPVTEIFIPNLAIADNSKIEGNFNNKTQQLNIRGNVPTIVYNDNVFYDFEINAGHEDERYIFELSCNKFMLSDTIWLDNLSFTNLLSNDSLTTQLKWKNEDTKIKNEGWVESVTSFDRSDRFNIKLLPSKVFINDSLWQANQDHIIHIDSTAYSVDNLKIYKNQEHIIIDGKVSRSYDDELKFGFREFDLANFDWFFEARNLKFDGLLSGNIIVANPFGIPNIVGDAEVIDFGFNHDHLGNLILETRYDVEEKGFEVLLEIIYFGNIGYNKPIVGSGFYYPEREGDNFDLDFKIENLKMSIFSRYFEGFAQNFRGMASGNLRLAGAAEDPGLTGKVRLARTGFRVDYLNTSYTFAHEVEFGKNYFAFDDLVLNDTIGNRAKASGRVYHDQFRDFALDIELFPENIILLNTRDTRNDLYYGSAFATGRAHIHGPVDNIVMDIQARTNRGTQFFLPLTYRGELKESAYITFVSNNNDDTVQINNQTPHIAQTSGITLNFDLEITPDAEVQLIFDSQIGDIIRGRGYGNLNLEITSQGSFNMYGDYTIEEGDYLFTLQNMLNKRFRIEQGSTIRWAGDPMDAEIDLNASYRVRTALYDLVMMEDEELSDVYRRRVPVDVVLQMKNELFNPDLAFQIELPQSDEATREMVDRLITTEQEKNRQIFSLLVLGRFLPEDHHRYDATMGYGVGMTSTEILSNQISNWLSQISNEFDIGVNYRPGDEISSQELEVALSTQLFEDRLIIDGQVGMAGDHPSSDHDASNIIGDVNIEYKITPEGRFRVKAFNRSNTMDVINTNSMYTQGVGLFYRKEFDRFKELFQRRQEETDDLDEYSSE